MSLVGTSPRETPAYSPLLEAKRTSADGPIYETQKAGVYGAPVFYDPTLTQTGIEVFQ